MLLLVFYVLFMHVYGAAELP